MDIRKHLIYIAVLTAITLGILAIVANDANYRQTTSAGTTTITTDNKD